MPNEAFFNLPAERKEQIVNAAIDQVAEHHYDKVTIDRMLEAAGIPKDSFYQYFANKDDLYVYLFTEVGDTKLGLIESLRAQVPVPSFREFVLAYTGKLKQYQTGNACIATLKQAFLEQRVVKRKGIAIES